MRKRIKVVSFPELIKWTLVSTRKLIVFQLVLDKSCINFRCLDTRTIKDPPLMMKRKREREGSEIRCENIKYHA